MRNLEWYEVFMIGVVVGAIMIMVLVVLEDSELGTASELCGKMWRPQDMSWYTAERVIPVNASPDNRTVIVVCKLENLTGELGMVY
jgi:hypothetical protein